jgi:DNA-directed RNA polymerase specialized sigma24 family protein
MVNTEVSGSMQEQCNKRLDTLYRESHTWLLKASYNICKSMIESEELVSDLYVYLSKECREKLWWGNSYNLIYCQKFLKHRWYNRAEKIGRYIHTGDITIMDKEYEIYDEDRDIAVMQAYDNVRKELQSLQVTKLWPQARLYEMYWMSEDTLNEVAQKIGISKSTTFLAIKKIRKHMQGVIDNPFK